MSHDHRELGQRIAKLLLGLFAVLIATSVFALAAAGHDIQPSGIADAAGLFIDGMQLIMEGLGLALLLLL